MAGADDVDSDLDKSRRTKNAGLGLSVLSFLKHFKKQESPKNIFTIKKAELNNNKKFKF